MVSQPHETKLDAAALLEAVCEAARTRYPIQRITLPNRDDHGPLRVHLLIVTYLGDEPFDPHSVRSDYVEDWGWLGAHTYPYSYRHVRQDAEGIVGGNITALEARKLLRRYGRSARFEPKPGIFEEVKA